MIDSAGPYRGLRTALQCQIRREADVEEPSGYDKVGAWLPRALLRPPVCLRCQRLGVRSVVTSSTLKSHNHWFFVRRTSQSILI